LLTGDNDAEKATRLAEERDLTRKVWVGGIISTLLIVGSLPIMTGLSLPSSDMAPQFLVSVGADGSCAVLVWSLLLYQCWKAFKRHAATMDTLVTIGTGAAYAYSVFGNYFPWILHSPGVMPDVYYEAAAVIITLILLGTPV
jgi:Cu+-exporting ATPase